MTSDECHSPPLATEGERWNDDPVAEASGWNFFLVEGLQGDRMDGISEGKKKGMQIKRREKR